MLLKASFYDSAYVTLVKYRLHWLHFYGKIIRELTLSASLKPINAIFKQLPNETRYKKLFLFTFFIVQLLSFQKCLYEYFSGCDGESERWEFSISTFIHHLPLYIESKFCDEEKPCAAQLKTIWQNSFGTFCHFVFKYDAFNPHKIICHKN